MDKIPHTKAYRISLGLTIGSFILLLISAASTGAGNPTMGAVAGCSMILFLSTLFLWLIAMSKHDTRMKLAREAAKKKEREKELADLSKEERHLELQNYIQDVRKAQSLAGWSYLGIVIPLLGWILAGISLSTLQAIPDDLSSSLTKRKKQASGNANFSIILSTLVAVIYLIISISSASSNHDSSATAQTPQQSNNLNNLQAQNACIANAQAEVDNNPLYQPVSGDANSYALSQQSRAMAMQPKIASCKTQYPTN